VSTQIEALEKGHRFPEVSFVLDEGTVSRYTAAVEDEALPPLAEAGGKAFVPPMAVAAFALRALMEAIALPAGAVHASQEFQFLRPTLVGEKITASVWLAQRSQRSDWLVVAVGVEAKGEGEDPVLRGRVNALIPT
jgi:acyl dehydratase